MDILITVISAPFTWGLLVGLIFAAWAFFAGWSAKRALRKQVRDLEAHARTQLEISARGRQALLDETADLKQKNENLRISLAALQAKPEKARLRQLHLYDKAVHLMYERAPGFSAVWENALRDAQGDLDKTATGLLPWLRRIVHPSLSAAPAPLPPPGDPPTPT